MIVSRRYVLSGRVQGVGFRFFAEDQARHEGLNGHVRNLPDGRVEVVVEGDLESVLRFEHAMHRGPRGARVDHVDSEDMPPSGRASGFVIAG